MNTRHLTNQNVMKTDWGFTDRQAMLKAASAKFSQRSDAETVPPVWMADMSGMDKRSVKARLNGHPSLRAAWWNTFSNMHQLFSRSGSMERAMYDFHRLHHAPTLFVAQLSHDYKKFADTARVYGLGKAMKDYLDEGVAR